MGLQSSWWHFHLLGLQCFIAAYLLGAQQWGWNWYSASSWCKSPYLLLLLCQAWTIFNTYLHNHKQHFLVKNHQTTCTETRYTLNSNHLAAVVLSLLHLHCKFNNFHWNIHVFQRIFRAYALQCSTQPPSALGSEMFRFYFLSNKLGQCFVSWHSVKDFCLDHAWVSS